MTIVRVSNSGWTSVDKIVLIKARPPTLRERLDSFVVWIKGGVTLLRDNFEYETTMCKMCQTIEIEKKSEIVHHLTQYADTLDPYHLEQGKKALKEYSNE